MKEHAKRDSLGRFVKGCKIKLGTVHSPETRQKLKERHKGMTGKHQPLSQRLAVTGENNWNWQGGITPRNFKIRNSLKYKEWRTAVFERDNYTCQAVGCGARGVKIHADHIEAFSVILKKHGVDSFQAALICQDLWDIKNGRTLCVPCHRKTDNYAGKAVQNYGITDP